MLSLDGWSHVAEQMRLSNTVLGAGLSCSREISGNGPKIRRRYLSAFFTFSLSRRIVEA